MGTLHLAVATAAVLWLLVAAPPAAPGQEIPDVATSLKKVDALLARGDNRQAWQILQELPGDGRNRGERLWRMACAQYEMGRIADSQQNAMGFYRQAEGYARRAIADDPNSGAGYKWLAIALGAQTDASDTQSKIRLSREVREAIEKAIALAPDDDIAYLVLSRWHYKVAALDFFSRAVAGIVYGGLPEASLGAAEDLLLRAIALHDRIAHRYYLAKVYERMGRRAEAKVQLQQALLLAVTFPEEAEEQQRCRDKLRAWQ